MPVWSCGLGRMVDLGRERRAGGEVMLAGGSGGRGWCATARLAPDRGSSGADSAGSTIATPERELQFVAIGNSGYLILELGGLDAEIAEDGEDAAVVAFAGG